jgi:hypothetical protein
MQRFKQLGGDGFCDGHALILVLVLVLDAGTAACGGRRNVTVGTIEA